MTKPARRSLASTIGTTLAKIFQHLDVWLLVGLAAALSALFFFAWLAEEMLEGETRVFDESVRAFVNNHASPSLTTIMRLATQLGSVRWLIVFGVCVAVAFILARWWRDIARFVLTMAGAITLNITLKLSFARTRPDAFFEMPVPASYSFPSGHALLSLCFYGAVAVISTSRLQSGTGSFMVWAAAALLVALIGYSRIYLGIHYPTDVLASYAIGLAWVSIVFFADRLRRRRRAITNHAL